VYDPRLPLMEGRLTKLSSKSERNWRKRLFVLQGRSLRYYKQKGSDKFSMGGRSKAGVSRTEGRTERTERNERNESTAGESTAFQLALARQEAEERFEEEQAREKQRGQMAGTVTITAESAVIEGVVKDNKRNCFQLVTPVCTIQYAYSTHTLYSYTLHSYTKHHTLYSYTLHSHTIQYTILHTLYASSHTLYASSHILHRGNPCSHSLIRGQIWWNGWHESGA
jgi:hypothetical protein